MSETASQSHPPKRNLAAFTMIPTPSLIGSDRVKLISLNYYCSASQFRPIEEPQPRMPAITLNFQLNSHKLVNSASNILLKDLSWTSNMTELTAAFSTRPRPKVTQKYSEIFLSQYERSKTIKWRALSYTSVTSGTMVKTAHNGNILISLEPVLQK